MIENRVLVNFVNDAGGYIRGQQRLHDTVKQFNPDLPILLYKDEPSIGSPMHTENPYAFKIYAIEAAINAGYRQILWLDASVYAIKSLEPIFQEILTNGYIMQYAGALAGTWGNDNCLNYFGVSRDEAMGILMYGNAGFLGLNLDFEISRTFFERWKQSMLAGAFKGGWNNHDKKESQDARCHGHRHDMVCGSIIAHQLGMQYKSSEEWLQYAAPEDAVLNETIILKAQGML